MKIIYSEQLCDLVDAVPLINEGLPQDVKHLTLDP